MGLTPCKGVLVLYGWLMFCSTVEDTTFVSDKVAILLLYIYNIYILVNASTSNLYAFFPLAFSSL